MICHRPFRGSDHFFIMIDTFLVFLIILIEHFYESLYVVDSSRQINFIVLADTPRLFYLFDFIFFHIKITSKQIGVIKTNDADVPRQRSRIESIFRDDQSENPKLCRKRGHLKGKNGQGY